MSSTSKDQTQDRLALRSRLSDIAKVPEWIESLASRHAIPPAVQQAINLCLEEVLTNVIRHGYGNQSDRGITVRFTRPRDRFFVFTVEDEAPRFNPLDVPELPALDPGSAFRVGGQGLRFLRRFADSLEYEPTPTGNRLSIGFSAVTSAASTE